MTTSNGLTVVGQATADYLQENYYNFVQGSRYIILSLGA